MARVIFALVCVGTLISQNALANPILTSAFPNLPLPAIAETCVDTISPVLPQPFRQCVSPSNVLITDSSPSVCNNLANTLQLLIVSKLLQGNMGCGVPLVNELPLLDTVITNGCGQIVTPPVVAPNVVSAPNLVQTVLPNGLTSTTSCGCKTVLPQCGCNTALPQCGCNTALPKCGCNTILPQCGCNTVLPQCGGPILI